MTEAPAPNSADLAAHLLGSHAATGRWAAAIEAVPRGWFVPDVAWAFDPDSGKSVAVDRRADPDDWARAVYSDAALVVQWDDGDHHGTEPGTVPTSSASQPSVVAGMLEDARLEPGMRVLEAGTGTGWSAALTTHVTGPLTVTTIEFDPHVAKLANRNLTRAGVQVRTEIGDAADGFETDAPFDRVIATYGVRRIPPAWIAQTRPGGLVVAPWGTDYMYRDAVAVLTVAGDGTASGKFTQPVEFMKGRNDRLPFPTHAEYLAAFPAVVPAATTIDGALDLADVIGSRDRWDPVVFITGMLVPDVTHVVDARNRDMPTVWWYSLNDLSWAAATFPVDGAAAVTCGGKRNLWAEVKAAHGWWASQGRPELERFGITADGRNEVAWLDEPGNVLPQFGG